MSNQELSERVSLSPSPCLRRVRQLEGAGMVRGYTGLVEERAYGLPMTVFVRVRLQVHDTRTVTAFEAAVGWMDAVLDCYVMPGNADYLLHVLTESLADYEHFVRTQLHAVPGIASIDTSFAYGHVKRATVFPPVIGSVGVPGRQTARHGWASVRLTGVFWKLVMFSGLGAAAHVSATKVPTDALGLRRAVIVPAAIILKAFWQMSRGPARSCRAGCSRAPKPAQ